MACGSDQQSEDDISCISCSLHFAEPIVIQVHTFVLIADDHPLYKWQAPIILSFS